MQNIGDKALDVLGTNPSIENGNHTDFAFEHVCAMSFTSRENGSRHIGKVQGSLCIEYFVSGFGMDGKIEYTATHIFSNQDWWRNPSLASVTALAIDLIIVVKVALGSLFNSAC